MIGIVSTVIQLAEDTKFDETKVTPGVEGFIFTGLMAAAIITLGFLLVNRLRRNAYRHEVQEQIAEELGSDAGNPGAASRGRSADESADRSDGAAGGETRN
ncbi:hypothetical protein JD292_05885 [Leucobacter sp. CSA2]|uniref:Uncharacterized protein n=1 Tax=Leucobacter edaphi TaxID=2796472 RepID=A0A934QE36_9MICO|nr:hypothetical protein [Leucobacter edaphi]MBK0421599.1 hypothetical protein [Leucobacter edaphi]